MRINFDSSYNDIKKIIRTFNNQTPNNKNISNNSFTTTLKDIIEDDVTAHKTNKNTISNNSIPKKSSLSFSNENIKLKNLLAYNLEDFKLEKADIMTDFSDYPLPKTDEVNNAGKEDTVKTPTIVSAKRIPHDNKLSFNESYNKTSNNNLKINVEKIDKDIISKIIKDEGKKQGIDPALALAVAKVESSMNPMAISTDGHYSKGLFQLLDSTGKELMANFAKYEHYMPYDVKQNSTLGVNYLRELHQTFADANKLNNNTITNVAFNADSLEKFAIAAFNAGQGRVASAQEKALKAGKDPSIFENVNEYLPSITRDYVKKVIQAKNEYSKNI